MPSCYLLAVCKSSALDSATNNWSLYTLVEQIQTNVDKLPAVSPLEVHIFLDHDPEEIGAELELRLVMISKGGQESISGSMPIKAPTQRHRIRIDGLLVPAVGNFELRFDWRIKGTEKWKRSDVFWPLVVEKIPEQAAGQVVTH